MNHLYEAKTNMKNILLLILTLTHSLVWCAIPLPKQITVLVQSINTYIDRTEDELNSEHKTKIVLAKRQLENAQETIDELFGSRYGNKFDHSHPAILKFQKRFKQLEIKIKNSR